MTLSVQDGVLVFVLLISKRLELLAMHVKMARFKDNDKIGPKSDFPGFSVNNDDDNHHHHHHNVKKKMMMMIMRIMMTMTMLMTTIIISSLSSVNTYNPLHEKNPITVASSIFKIVVSTKGFLSEMKNRWYKVNIRCVNSMRYVHSHTDIKRINW